ncbi:MAG: RIP metalloprotease RseP [Bdellovibrionota bacterium]
MSWFAAKFLAPVLVLGILVLVHEFGHFIVAKWCKVGVLKFAIGFGPAICKFRKGETIYQIGLIPLGGFVRMVGDMPDSLTGKQASDDAVRDGDDDVYVDPELSPEAVAMLSDRHRWFIEKGLLARSAIVFAGPLFNFLLAIVFTFFCVSFWGERVPDTSPRLGSVMDGSPAEAAGLKDNDLVKSIDGKPVTSWEELAGTIHNGTGAPVVLKIDRAGAELEVTAKPEAKSVSSGGQQKNAYFLGITPVESAQHVRVGFVQAAIDSVQVTYENTRTIYIGIWSMIRGRVSTDELAGPLYIVKAAGHHAQRGIEELMYLTSALSLSLAVLNLLPIPILDGGHLFFFFLEALIGPISIRKKEFAQQVGLILLLSLMVFAIRNDITRKSPAEPKEKQKWDSFGNGEQSQPGAAQNPQPGGAPSGGTPQP